MQSDNSSEVAAHVLSSPAQPKEDASDKLSVSRARTQLAGVFRLGSHTMLMMSGLGYGAKASPLRVAAGGIGFPAAAMVTAFASTDKGNSSHSALESFRPHNLINTYADLNATSALFLMASGFHMNRKTEMLAGAWTASAFILKRIMPETPDDQRRPLKKKHDDALHIQGTIDQYVDDVEHRPVKLASDMLQVSAGLVLLDAITHRDIARGISGVLLGASNFCMRETYKSDHEKNGAAIR